MKDMKQHQKMPEKGMDKKHEGEHGKPMPKPMLKDAGTKAMPQPMSEAEEMAEMNAKREMMMAERDMQRMAARKSGPKVI